MKEFKFRVWDKRETKGSQTQEMLYDAQKHPLWFDFLDYPFAYKIMQFTGIKDKNGREVYEGDIIKFKYFVGDFAWEFMNEDEERENLEMINKEYIGTVSPSILIPINLEIVCGDPESTHLIFPLSYAMRGEVIGNIIK